METEGDALDGVGVLAEDAAYLSCKIAADAHCSIQVT